MKRAMKNLGKRINSRRRAFTLIELLVVIAVIATLAGFLFPLAAAAKRHATIQRTQAEMAQIETAIESYKSTYGFYPPDNSSGSLTNQLYYELTGTLYGSANNTYTNLNSSDSLTANAVQNIFNIGGFMNCTKPGADEDSRKAENFLPALKSGQIGTITSDGTSVKLLVGSVGGPYQNYQPLGRPDLNPWRYKSSGTLTNNPGSYELWIQIVFKPGQTNLICNWSKQPQINNPLP